MKKILFLLLLISLTISALTVSNGVHAEEEEPKYGGTIVAAHIGDPRILNPALSTSSLDMHVSQNVFNCLIDVNHLNEPVPELAKSWEWSEDMLSLTLHLVENAKFHDGVLFTAADVKFWWEEIQPKNPAPKLIGIINSVEVIDEHTVVMTVDQPFALDRNLHLQAGVTIVPKHLYEGTDVTKNPYNMEPIGTGPFKFAEYVPGDRVTLVRNPEYFKEGLPYLDKIIYKIIPDEGSRVLALKTGEVDFLMCWGGISERSLQEVEGFPGISTGYPVLLDATIEYFFMNQAFEPLADKRVREAISYAVDRELLLERGHYGVGAVCYGPWSPLTIGYPEDFEPIYTYNPEKAEELLDAAGWERGPGDVRFSVRLVTDAAQESWGKACEIIKENLRDVGIDVAIIPLSRLAWISAIWDQFDFELAYSWGGVAPDVLHRGRVTYHGDYSGGGAGAFENFMYNNSEVNRLWDEYEFSPNTEERIEVIKQIYRLIYADVPRVWLTETGQQIAWNSHFHNVYETELAVSGGRRRWDTIWWDLGYEASPEEAASAIEEARGKISSLKAQLYDTTQSEIRLTEAEQALSEKDYAEASRLAGIAVTEAIAPYWLYGIVIVAIVAVIGGIVYWRRRYKK